MGHIDKVCTGDRAHFFKHGHRDSGKPGTVATIKPGRVRWVTIAFDDGGSLTEPEAYFDRNDFYPFVRAELKEHDPVLHDLLEEIWGVKN